MDEEEIQKEYLKCFDLVESELRKTVLSVLPKNEKGLMPPTSKECGSIAVFLDYFFVIEKFLKCRIPQKNYEIKKSQVILNNPLQNENRKRIAQLENELKKGNVNINLPSYNYLPKSANRFFRTEYNNPDRYNNDYAADMFGIKHLHLTSSSDDVLLYYCISNSNYYLLDIGNHFSFYSDRIIRIVFDEFQEILNDIGIHELPGVHAPNTTYSEQELMQYWENGRSPTIAYNGKAYMGSPMTTSSINMNLVSILQNTIYSVEQGIRKIVKENGIERLELNKVKSRLSIKYGSLFFHDGVKEYVLPIYYTKKLQIVNGILA